MSPAQPAPHPGFRQLNMTALIVTDPKAAATKILLAYRLAGANLRKAAVEHLDCTERTLHRWVDKLRLRGELEKITRSLEKKGELDAHRRPVKA
jgi:hypothetical protein